MQFRDCISAVGCKVLSDLHSMGRDRGDVPGTYPSQCRPLPTLKHRTRFRYFLLAAIVEERGPNPRA